MQNYKNHYIVRRFGLTLDPYQWHKKRKLWIIIISYCVSKYSKSLLLSFFVVCGHISVFPPHFWTLVKIQIVIIVNKCASLSIAASHDDTSNMIYRIDLTTLCQLIKLIFFLNIRYQMTTLFFPTRMRRDMHFIFERKRLHPVSYSSI